VLYKTKELRRSQYASFPDWPGGVYGTPCMSGSRPGALIAVRKWQERWRWTWQLCGTIVMSPTCGHSCASFSLACPDAPLPQATWTALMYHGRAGYVKSTKEIVTACYALAEGEPFTFCLSRVRVAVTAL
jgi:hypothetical protein